jgi:hypothetical protein
MSQVNPQEGITSKNFLPDSFFNRNGAEDMRYVGEAYLIYRFVGNIITMLTCSMTHEMQLTVKDDGSLLTSGIGARI